MRQVGRPRDADAVLPGDLRIHSVVHIQRAAVEAEAERLDRQLCAGVIIHRAAMASGPGQFHSGFLAMRGCRLVLLMDGRRSDGVTPAAVMPSSVVHPAEVLTTLTMLRACLVASSKSVTVKHSKAPFHAGPVR